jgi:putative CocE/NonD family hydrolase
MDQLRWFDYWLKGIDSGIMNEPPVKLEIRTGGSSKRYEFRFENEWPIARAEWTKMYLKIEREPSADPNATEGQLVSTSPQKSAKLTYSAGGAPAAHGRGDGHSGVSLETAPMEEDTEITGPIALAVWVSSTSEDMDIFATLRNIGPDGKEVFEVGSQGQPVPLTKGWLRASQRKLDPALSLPYRPYHAHDERLWLKPGEPVECQVEVWPTCIVLHKGHRLRLDIQPRDGIGSAPYTHYQADYNLGAENTIYAGGDKASYLLLPVIPPRKN